MGVHASQELIASADRQLDSEGYTIVPSGLADADLGSIAQELDQISNGRSGSRDILPPHHLISGFLRSNPLRALLQSLMGPEVKPVRVIYFDKTSKHNWAVPWHQDRIIAVDRQLESAEVSSWTVKHGIQHCEAPVSLLERMLILRWHLDPAARSDGGLRVLPGSHAFGRLKHVDIEMLRKRVEPENVEAGAGDLLLMRPLLVHSSSMRRGAGRRRVVHVDLAAEPAPYPLGWAWG